MKKLLILPIAFACLFGLSFLFTGCQEEEGVLPVENLANGGFTPIK